MARTHGAKTGSAIPAWAWEELQTADEGPASHRDPSVGSAAETMMEDEWSSCLREAMGLSGAGSLAD